MGARIITISNYKGGVGKTTTAVNMAYILAAVGKKVLLIDADPQANASYMVWKYSESAKTLRDVLCYNKNMKSVIRRSRFKNLDIIPAQAEVEVVNERIRGDKQLYEALQILPIEGERYEYDYIIIDCQPTMQTLTKSAIYAADLLLIPFNTDGFSTAGLELMQDFIHQIEDERGDARPLEHRCIVTRMKKGKKELERIMKVMRENDFNISGKAIRESKACVTSIDTRKPVLMHRKKDDVTEDYIELVSEITNIDIKRVLIEKEIIKD